jgi:hypothetical protein
MSTQDNKAFACMCVHACMYACVCERKSKRGRMNERGNSAKREHLKIESTVVA